MKGTEYKKFIHLSKEVLKKEKITQDKIVISKSKDEVFTDFEALKRHFYNLQIKKLNNLPNHLTNFENHAKLRNIKVIWALDFNEVFEELEKIKNTFEVKNVWFKRDYLLDEIGIQHFLKEQNLSFSKSDEADIFVYQANGMIEDTGSLYLEFEEQQVAETINQLKPKIFFTSFESIFANIQEVELYRSIFSLQKNLEKIPRYSLIYNPYKEPVTSPVYVIIIDNGRSNLLEDTEIRKTLACIHCKACNKVCPVTQTIGDEPYDNVFSGPIANIILPYLEESEEYEFLSQACILCGNCEKICPVNIPIPDLILKNRIRFQKNNTSGKLKSYLSNRKKMNSSSWIKDGLIRLNLNSEFKRNRRLRSLNEKTFNQLWIEQNNDKQNIK